MVFLPERQTKHGLGIKWQFSRFIPHIHFHTYNEMSNERSIIILEKDTVYIGVNSVKLMKYK